MIFPFFTLNSDYRASLFRQIHEIVFYGKGGYRWEEVYSMPIWLRNFTFKEINEFYEKEKEQIEKAQGREKLTAQTDPSKIKPLPKIQVPNFITSAKKPKK